MTVQNYRNPESPQASTQAQRGRGAALRPDGRFLDWQRGDFDDGWPSADEGGESRLKTELLVDRAKTVITSNTSPDVGFNRSINPYRGCEHGCIYCFARPSHAYLDLSPGLDFETKLFWKPEAASLLRRELTRPGYRCEPIALGINTDAWQPVERRTGLTRQILQVMVETRHPVSMITKSALIERDIDLLADLARDNLVQVMLSITTLDDDLARRLEPRAARPARRLETLRRLSDAGIPVGVLCAPLIPALNDHELEAVLEAAHANGAEAAGYVLLRLPYELKELFAEWLQRNAPGKARHVMSLLAAMRGGKTNDARFGHRMRGEGVYAELYRQRLHRSCERLGLNRHRRPLDSSLFKPPVVDAPPKAPSPQLDLF